MAVSANFPAVQTHQSGSSKPSSIHDSLCWRVVVVSCPSRRINQGRLSGSLSTSRYDGSGVGSGRQRSQALSLRVSATPRAVAGNVSPTLQFRRKIKIDFEPKAPSGLRAVTTTSSAFHRGFAWGAMLTTTADTSRSGCGVQAVMKAAAIKANRVDFTLLRLAILPSSAMFSCPERYLLRMGAG